MQLFIKAKLLTLVAAAGLMISCSTPEPVADMPAAVPTEPPFANAEPEKYQTFVLQTSPSGTVRFLIARDGDRWRIDSDLGQPRQTGSLHTDQKDFVLDYATRSYGEYTAGHGFDERPNMVEEITHGLFNSREIAVYENLGTDGGFAQYKMTDGKGKESIITIDLAKGLPIRKEIFNIADGNRMLEMTVWLEDFTTEVDPANFEIGKDFKKVSMDEMKKILSLSR